MRSLMDQIPERSIPLQNLAPAHGLVGIERNEPTTSLVYIDMHQNRQIPLRKTKYIPLPFPSHFILS
jgi:hypothetical protein